MNITPTKDSLFKKLGRIAGSKLPQIPDNQDIVYNFVAKEPAVTMGNCVVVADLHVPFYNEEFTSTVLPVAKRQGIKKMIIAGDLLDCISLKPDKFPANFEGVSFQTEIDVAGRLMEAWFSWFDEIWYLRGNHDWRLMSKVSNQLRMAEIGKLVSSKLETTDFRHIILTSGAKTWRITHPKSYSQIGGAVAKRLAGKFHQNVMSAHGHFFAHTYDISGKFHAIDTGGLVDPNLVEYLHMTGDTTHPMWNNAYWLIIDGVPISVLPGSAYLYL